MAKLIFIKVLGLGLALAACRAEPQMPTETAHAEPAQAEADAADEAAPTIPVTIRVGDTTHVFDVEVARTSQEQTRGLMFRESLPDDGGMIFPFDTPRIASFWMRNTLIPLDMIFVRADGRITNIARETVPYTLDSYRSVEPVVAVLEIAGGRSEELGIGAGDQVSWEAAPVAQE